MKLTSTQITALVKMAMAMAAADGVVKKEETDFLASELHRFGVKPAQVEPLMQQVVEMDFADAVKAMSELGEAEKHYVAAFLGTMMAVDREVDSSELALWQYTCSLCDFPKMTLSAALTAMRDL